MSAISTDSFLSDDALPAIKSMSQIAVLADHITPVLAYEKLRNESPYSFLFESSESDSRLARYSILGFDPCEVISIEGDRLTLQKRQDNGLYEAVKVEEATTPFDFMARRSALLKRKVPDSASHRANELPFEGGYVGYLGYGATQFFDKIAAQESDAMQVPDGIFALYDSAIIFDHKERQMKVLSFRGETHCREIVEKLEKNQIRNQISIFKHPSSNTDFHAKVEPAMSKQDFISKVLRCKDFIAEGQVFQIVLAQRFAHPFAGDAFSIYRALQSINPSPYGYYLQFPNFAYLGASPERLLACRNAELSLTALAGTRPRGKTEEEEQILEADLRSSEKELAEHYMLVDLGRNDLGRVAKIGSVAWGEIARVTRYGQVMHLSTDISASLADGLNCFDAIKSCFPAGTVSGAPKIRAMELLSELEPEKRGIYSGMVGYFDLKGNSDSAIAIRSALVKDGIAHISAGAGIVQDSEPEAEYEETRNKALSVLKAIHIAEGM